MEDINKKVVSIFERHKANKLNNDDAKVIECDDDIYCVTVKTDKHGNPFNRAELLEDARMTEYIVKVLVDTPESSYINNYKVSGEKILEFLSKYTKRKKQGQVIEIDKYIPDDLA
ncbi:MAG: hypothetical protein MJ180_03330 [Candidatus Gastranaerophilales bacterium]|nr:hypothetical protein [Candidatus Gastranaerophilales bacterium]